jgi:hypothetical protein
MIKVFLYNYTKLFIHDRKTSWKIKKENATPQLQNNSIMTLEKKRKERNNSDAMLSKDKTQEGG